MRTDLIVASTVLINAGKEKVWQALTSPEIIKEYLFGTHTTTDWKVGSEVSFSGEYNGTSYSDHGKVLENIPGEKLSYTYWSGFSGLEDKPENYSTIHYLLKEKDENTTEFTWTQAGFGNENGYNHSKEGMPAFLNQFKAIAER